MPARKDTKLSISIVIPTKDRRNDLSELLATILNQSHIPCEVLIVDDSHSRSARGVCAVFRPRFRLISAELKYIEGKEEGLTAARNLGVAVTKGSVVLFLDDDVLLERNVLQVLASFLKNHSKALGVQVRILDKPNTGSFPPLKRIEGAVCKALMLSYREENRLAIRRSGASVFPDPLTRVVQAQRLSGCSCYRRKVFDQLRFDTNLKRYGFMEDLDFSYRLYKKDPHALYAIPEAKIIHKMSPEVVQNGVSGLLANERDVEGLVKHLRWLVDHPEEWPRMLEAGRKHIEKEYNAKVQGQRLASIYRGLLE